MKNIKIFILFFALITATATHALPDDCDTPDYGKPLLIIFEATGEWLNHYIFSWLDQPALEPRLPYGGLGLPRHPYPVLNHYNALVCITICNHLIQNLKQSPQ